MFVVDASVVLAWCFTDQEDSDGERALRRLEREEAIAPGHWPLEVANALGAAERHGRIHPAELPRLRALLAALPVAVVAVELGAATVGTLEAARAYDLTAYDAAYLELARTRGVPLATVDARLRAACARAGVEVIA